ncbi:TrbC family F-type conjugative pilus assembly protein [Sphingobium sp. WW5]|uniref:Conjugal transfer protein TrbC n=3 Tax=Sphingobium yanoikuyae TaxID=13690 RepID=A0A084EJ25_SPHYA|nr:Conjugal transfer protein TrbC [Sphingobium yanoikuyae]
MPICASSIPDSHMAPLVLALALMGAAQGQAREAQPANEGTAAMERLQKAKASANPAVHAGPDTIPDPSPALKRRAFEAMRKRRVDPRMEAQARAAQIEAANALAAEQQAMSARLHQALGLAPLDATAMPNPATSNASAKAWVPLLFASSSMPIETLRTYARQLERVGGVIAFRGVPGGLTKIGPMAELTARMLRVDPGCEGPACTMRNVQVVIDPILFRQHGIGRVPALAMVPGDPTQPYCEREDETAPRAAHLVLGDAALSGLLDEYARLGGKEEVRDASARLAGR